MKKQSTDGMDPEFQLTGSATDIRDEESLFPDLPKEPQAGSAPEFDQEFLDFMISLTFYLSGKQGHLVLDFENGMREWGMFLHNFKAQARKLSPKTRALTDSLIGDFQTLEKHCPESLKLRSHAARLMELPYTIPADDGYMTFASSGFPKDVRNIFADHPILQQVVREELRGVPGLVFQI